LRPTTKYSCETCGFALWIPIAELSVSVLGLYDDARFPGRCLLALREHFDEFEAISTEIAAAFALDIQKSGRAVKQAAGARRVNFAILGNEEPHVHAHIIPRAREGDPIPNRPPWEHPRPKTLLSGDKKIQLIASISEYLAKEGKTG
jgi:diadenosine tetraphosphate (Ap4A) HIT family hydrolase